MKEIRIKTFPVSTNNMYFGRRVMTPQARKTKEAITWEADYAWGRKSLSGPVRMDIQLHYKDARRHDIDNIKLLLDALTGVVYDDDSQIVELNLKKYHKAKEAKIDIQIYEA